ncbi:MAG: AraC family transcriptional regulator [Calditrichaeota bacterium]|nr:AraC family transcriptional regulator [Calditrichota bacterium]
MTAQFKSFKPFLITLVLIALGLSLIDRIQSANYASKTPTYYCPPCGCSNDKIAYTEPMNCVRCSMPLVEERPSFTSRLANGIAPIFRISFETRLIYDKIVFPAFLISTILAIIILLKYRRRPANIFLSLFVMAFSLYALHYHFNHLTERLGHTYEYLFFPISLLSGSAGFLYLYCLFYTQRKRQFSKNDLIHFAPIALIFLLFLSIYFESGFSKYKLMLEPSFFSPSQFEQLLFILLSYFYIRRTDSLIEANASLSEVEIKWLRQLTFGFKLVLAVWTACMTFNLIFFNLGMVIISYYPLWISMAVYIYFIMTKCIANPQLITYKEGAWSSKRNLSDLDIKRLTDQLLKLMTDRKVYLNSQLNLESLAKEMSINARDLSVILNYGVGKSFYDFINEYRIQEVKIKLLDDNYQNFTNEAIASEAGFSSKSAFHSAFKKCVHMTPNDYKKSFSN